MAERSLYERLSKGIADAVTDIRQEVAEKPMLGRAVTEREGECTQAGQTQHMTASSRTATQQLTRT